MIIFYMPEFLQRKSDQEVKMRNYKADLIANLSIYFVFKIDILLS